MGFGTVKIVVANENLMPYKKYDKDAGWDLKANIESPVTICPGEILSVGTGIKIAIPVGYVGDIRPRSGLASKGVAAQYGTIDPNYRGEIGITLINTGNKAYTIHPLERVAQLVIVKIALVSELHAVPELPESDRDDGGFGHTGRF